MCRVALVAGLGLCVALAAVAQAQQRHSGLVKALDDRARALRGRLQKAREPLARSWTALEAGLIRGASKESMAIASFLLPSALTTAEQEKPDTVRVRAADVLRYAQTACANDKLWTPTVPRAQRDEFPQRMQAYCGGVREWAECRAGTVLLDEWARPEGRWQELQAAWTTVRDRLGKQPDFSSEAKGKYSSRLGKINPQVSKGWRDLRLPQDLDALVGGLGDLGDLCDQEFGRVDRELQEGLDALRILSPQIVALQRMLGSPLPDVTSAQQPDDGVPPPAPPPTPGEIDALARELGQELAALSASLGRVAERLDALEASIGATDAGPPLAQRLSDLSDRLDRLQVRVETVEGTAGRAGSIAAPAGDPEAESAEGPDALARGRPIWTLVVLLVVGMAAAVIVALALSRRSVQSQGYVPREELEARLGDEMSAMAARVAEVHDRAAASVRQDDWRSRSDRTDARLSSVRSLADELTHAQERMGSEIGEWQARNERESAALDRWLDAVPNLPPTAVMQAGGRWGSFRERATELLTRAENHRAGGLGRPSERMQRLEERLREVLWEVSAGLGAIAVLSEVEEADAAAHESQSVRLARLILALSGWRINNSVIEGEEVLAECVKRLLAQYRSETLRYQATSESSKVLAAVSEFDWTLFGISLQMQCDGRAVGTDIREAGVLWQRVGEAHNGTLRVLFPLIRQGSSVVYPGIVSYG